MRKEMKSDARNIPSSFWVEYLRRGVQPGGEPFAPWTNSEIAAFFRDLGVPELSTAAKVTRRYGKGVKGV